MRALKVPVGKPYLTKLRCMYVAPSAPCRLYGLHQQAKQGDNATERPMWAEKGGLDFEGRARYDAWAAVKGLQPEEAKLRFVKLFYEFPPSALYSDTRGGVTA
jgi:acyl-CoA-binding protein